MVYVDNNATTEMDAAVFQEMEPFLRRLVPNPSSPYTPARRSAAALQQARERVAGLFHAAPREVIFTSGGTESNGLALLGALGARADGRRRLVVSAIEHSSVFETAKALAERGYPVDYIPATPGGVIDVAAAERLIGPDTALVSVVLAHNETGVIQPVAHIATMAARAGALMHTDAVQALGKIPVDVRALGVQLLSCGAHKVHGPKGVGALYVREGTPLAPPWRGGDQEHGQRAGTENVAGIIGFGCAAGLAGQRLGAGEVTPDLRDAFEQRVCAALGGVEVLGVGEARLPNTSFLHIEGVESEALIARLDLLDICASSGSACASGAALPSRALRAMGRARAGWGTLRVSFGRGNRPEDVDSLVGAITGSVHGLRSIRA